MEILFVTRPIAPPWNEGSKNITWQLAQKMMHNTSHLLTVRAKNLPVISKNIVHYPIYSNSELTLSQKMRLFFFLLFNMPDVDILHFFFVPTIMTSGLLLFISKLHKKRVVQTIPCLPSNFTSKRALKKLIFSDIVIVYSKFTEKYLRTLKVPSIVRINAGIEIEKFTNAKHSNEIRTEIGLYNDAVIVLVSGEYSRLGSIKMLKKVLPEVVKKCPKCHFLMACRILVDEDLHIEEKLQDFVIKNNIGNQVHFVGEVSDFPGLLKSSDVFLFLLSDMSGKIDMPLTVLEAMAAGLPVVSCDIPPLDEIFVKPNDFIVDVEDVEATVHAILALAKDPQKRREQGIRNQKKIIQKYDLDQMVKKYEALYDSFN